MTEWALPADEQPVFHHAAGGGERDGLAGSAIPARRAVAQLPGALSRDQRAAQADAAGVRRGRRDAGRARRASGRSTTCYRGQSNDCYWHGLVRRHLHRPHAHGDARRADRGRGPGAGRQRAATWRRPTTTWTASTRSCSARPGRRCWSTSPRAPASRRGTCGRAGRARVGAPRRPEPYHEKLRQAEAAAAAKPTARRSARNPDGQKRLSQVARVRPRRAAQRVGPALCRRGGEGDWARAPWSVVQAVESEVRLTRSEGGLSVSKSIVLGGDRLAPTLTVRLEVAAVVQAVDGELALEWNLNLQGGGESAGLLPLGQAGKFATTVAGRSRPRPCAVVWQQLVWTST